MNSEDTVLDFAAASFRSVWALELLFVLRRHRGRVWQASEIIAELRSSRVVVAEALNNLTTVGLVFEEGKGNYRYQAKLEALDELVADLEKLYALKPASVVRKIVTTPNAKLQILSDAFRIKE